MKTIREPLGPPEPERYHLTCNNRNCRAILECTGNEMKREWREWREYKHGAIYKMLCPHCNYESCFEEQYLDRYLAPEK